MPPTIRAVAEWSVVAQAQQPAVPVGDVVATLPLVNAGKVRALGVSSIARIPSAPEIPTIAESGVPGYEGVG